MTLPLSAVTCQRTDIPASSPESTAALDKTKEIIDLNRRFPFYDLLVTLDHKLTGKYLDVYYGKATTKEKIIEDHEHLIGTIDHFLENANAINPYAAFNLFLSDKKSKLLINIDSQRANGKVNKLISFELKTDDQNLRKRFEELKRDYKLWDSSIDPNTTTQLVKVLTNHLEHIPGIELVAVKDSDGASICLQPVSSVKKVFKSISLFH